MYDSTWLKYLPIIRILMKRSADSVQNLDLNRFDFPNVVIFQIVNMYLLYN